MPLRTARPLAFLGLPLIAPLLAGCAEPEREASESRDSGHSGAEAGHSLEGTTEAGAETTDGPERIDVEDGRGSTGGDVVSGCDEVDLLFVIDNSGSMLDEQRNLVDSFDGFIGGIRDQLTEQSYHVGVITTDVYEGQPAHCRELGALISATSGEGSSEAACGPWGGGSRRYMTDEDDLTQGFSCAALPGISGDGDERPAAATLAALDPDAHGLELCNFGFLRQDALLVIVLITDEEDDHETEGCPGNPFANNPGSDGDPSAWRSAIVAAKGGRENGIVMLSLVGPPGPDPAACPKLSKCADGKIGAEPAPRLTELTESLTWGFVGRVCEQQGYGAFFNSAIETVVQACEEFPPVG